VSNIFIISDLIEISTRLVGLFSEKQTRHKKNMQNSVWIIITNRNNFFLYY